MIKFKEYIQQLSKIATSFGTHSKEYVQNLPVLETVFGSHSKESEKERKPIKESVDSEIESHSSSEAAKIHKENKADSNPFIKAYSVHSSPVNSSLHTGKTGKTNLIINGLDKALDKHIVHTPFHVYTGVIKSPSHLFRPGKKTTQVHLPAYISTTTKHSIANNFSIPDNTPVSKPEKHDIKAGSKDHKALLNYDHVIKLHLSKGTKAASIKSQAHYHHENEVLVHRGHDIEIHHKPTIDHKHRTVYWHARTIAHNPKPI